jgi:Fe-S-cluster-containing dehydrogenase component/anaerobic selenocysteine-containing dehydrogenase
MDQTKHESPRHWVATEELNPSYWQDEKVREKRAQEFYDKPIEALSAIENSQGFSLARRDFLTLMGASMAMSTVACVRRPVHKIIPYVVKPEEVTPGVANFYASTDPESGAGVVVRVREGRPIKLEGNDLHPLSQGALSARGQAAILNLYDPERLTHPVARNRGGSAKKVTWAELDSAAVEKLKKVASAGGKVAFVTGEVRSDSTRKIIADFLGQFQSSVHVEYEPLAMDEISAGQELCYGTAVVPHYRFEKADFILSLGADFMGTWPSATEAAGQWVKKRKLNGSEKSLSRLVTFETMMSLTGANSDERYPVRPGDELKVALALVHVLAANGAGIDADAKALVAGYRPDLVAKDLGMKDGGEALRKLALEMLKFKGRSLVLAGGISSKTEQALALQVAVNVLNSALGNEGQTIEGNGSVQPARKVGFAALQGLIQEMRDGKVAALVLWGANPAYALSPAAGFVEASKKVSTVLSISDRDDESAQLADWVAADHHWLENWGDAHPRKGLYSLQQPVIAPIHETRSGQDTLIAWTKGVSGKQLAENWHEYLRASWRQTVAPEFGVTAAGFEKFWEGALRDGVVDSAKGQSAGASARSLKAGAVAKLPKFKPASSESLSLALYSKISMGDGRHANNAWLQEMPDPITTVAWDNYLNVAPATAEKLGLRQDDVVEVIDASGGTNGGISVELPVNIQPGLHPQCVAAAVGYGRRNVGKVGNSKGWDLFPAVKVIPGQLVFSGQEVRLRRTGKFFKLAQTQWHHRAENRPIINDLTLAQYIKNPGESNHTDPHLRLKEVPTIWPVHDYSKGYQWGMSIDLNSCTGCGACIIACQAENNIPVVGRDNVRISREMHWIRIDRYYSGSPEQPSVVFQPMICQHCENAPCETVCPVLATVHSEDGLNQQIYNRCVGTRYCANNCPYKARRFNFFDHWKSYEGTLNMAWNPEVTVRSRGIMEKCTFCVQRIRDARDKAVLEGRHIKDGELKTACQQTCPTEAIAFGNINDEFSKVAKLRKHPRDFRVLEVLNTKPRVSYMTKVRNTQHEHSGGGH